MLNDLIELATTVVHPEHEPDIAPNLGSSKTTMARKRGASKSQSISSAADINGMLPPPTPASKSGTPARKPRSRSTTSPPGSPKPVVNAARPAAAPTAEGLGRYAAVVLLSFVFEAVLMSGVSQFFSTGELAAVSKKDPSELDIAGLASWKLALLSVYWYSGFDAYDVAALTLLIHTPTYILLGFFYTIRNSTIVTAAVVSVVANALPWYALRDLSPSHTPRHAHSKASLRNRPILTDPWTTIATSLLSTTIFTVILEAAFVSFLPTFAITRFSTIRSLVFAHGGAAAVPPLVLALILPGYACTEYLFTPSTAATPFTAPDFDPSTSTFAEHLYWNVWGWYSARQRTLIFRAALLGALMFAETVVYLAVAMEGVELSGALGYSSIWAVGVAVVGVALDWVGGPSD